MTRWEIARIPDAERRHEVDPKWAYRTHLHPADHYWCQYYGATCKAVAGFNRCEHAEPRDVGSDHNILDCRAYSPVPEAMSSWVEDILGIEAE